MIMEVNINNVTNNFIKPPFEVKKFVRASSTSENTICINAQTSRSSEEIGNSVSTFYMNICNEKNHKRRNICADKIEDGINICEFHVNNKEQEDIRRQLPLPTNERLLNKAMKFAQYDDVESLKILIDKGLNINITDHYGWSLIMVASFAGSEKAVKYLVSKGVQTGKRDSKGNTALYLASIKNHFKIVNLLIKSEKDSITSENLNEKTIEEIDFTYFCNVCKFTPSCSLKEHEASISHQFKLGRYFEKPIFGIPRNNIGFQMLLQQGWKDSNGLGPEGIGRKYPIKSVDKKDRHGIGHKPVNGKKCSNVYEELKQPFKKKSSRYLEKLKEKKLRKMLNEPDF